MTCDCCAQVIALGFGSGRSAVQAAEGSQSRCAGELWFAMFTLASQVAEALCKLLKDPSPDVQVSRMVTLLAL